MRNDMVYCQFCNSYYKRNYVHICSIDYYYCSACRQYVSGTHFCSESYSEDYHPPIYIPYSEPKHYKCPYCKGEFSEPVCKYEIGGTGENTYHCPFCNKQMKGFNNQRRK